MIKDHVALILGAGASRPYGFPLGEQLKHNIIDQLLYSRRLEPTDKTLFEILLSFGYDDRQLRDFANQLRLSHQPSIDAFLEERSEFMEVGKDALAANLIVQERIDDLLQKDMNNEKRKWYDYFLNLLGNREEFRSNNISIITFNYDRSLEYFLYNTLSARFGLKEPEVVDYISSIPIVHVYGQLGKPHFFDSNGRDYAPHLDKENLVKSAKGIKIIHEFLDISPELDRAQELIGKSRILVFIGFGFHRKNLERLFARKNFVGETVVSTFYGKEEGERNRDIEQIRLNTGVGVNSISIDPYAEDALGFLRKTNYLR